MTEQTRYLLGERADNYGWASLAIPPASVPVGEVEFRGEDAANLSAPVRQTPPNVLNRVNAWLATPPAEDPAAGDNVVLFLEPKGVDANGRAFLAVTAGGVPASGKAALRRIIEGSQIADRRTQELLRTFLVEAGTRGHEVPPTEVLESVKSSFGLKTLLSVKSSFALKDLLSVKSSFSGSSRSVLSFAAPPAVPTADNDPSGVVVALLDTGIGTHPWLPRDTWMDAERDLGWSPPQAASLPDPDEQDTNPDADPVDVFAGHGTFVAGLIRQLAPAARLLSLHCMNGDGVQPGERVVDGLEWLRDRVATGEPGTFVDVVCLACGYYEPKPSDDGHTIRLAEVLGELGDLGVQVVVAAGNDGADAPTFPAAFAHFAAAESLPDTPLVAVGAANPDGSRADFSNSGDWVRSWQPGTALVSSLPTSFGASADPAETRQFDPFNLVGGFAQWSGSSFAAGVLAGRLGAALELTRSTIPDVHERTRAARESLGIQT